MSARWPSLAASVARASAAPAMHGQLDQTARSVIRAFSVPATSALSADVERAVYVVQAPTATASTATASPVPCAQRPLRRVHQARGGASRSQRAGGPVVAQVQIDTDSSRCAPNRRPLASARAFTAGCAGGPLKSAWIFAIEGRRQRLRHRQAPAAFDLRLSVKALEVGGQVGVRRRASMLARQPNGIRRNRAVLPSSASTADYTAKSLRPPIDRRDDRAVAQFRRDVEGEHPQRQCREVPEPRGPPRPAARAIELRNRSDSPGWGFPAAVIVASSLRT